MVNFSACELLSQFAAGEVTAQALAAKCLDAIRRLDPQLRAYLHVDEADALAQAGAVDGKRRRGEPLGALAGLPVALKDVLCVRGQPATAGSRMLENFVSPYDAHVVTLLRGADAVISGKTNL